MRGLSKPLDNFKNETQKCIFHRDRVINVGKKSLL